jgi:hypothetical protein
MRSSLPCVAVVAAGTGIQISLLGLLVVNTRTPAPFWKTGVILFWKVQLGNFEISARSILTTGLQKSKRMNQIRPKKISKFPNCKLHLPLLPSHSNNRDQSRYSYSGKEEIVVTT